MKHKSERSQWSRARAIEEVQAFMRRHAIVGRIPTRHELLHLDPYPHYDLLYAIQVYLGGSRGMAKALRVARLDPRRHGSGYWEDPGRVYQGVRKVMRTLKIDRMPSQREIDASGNAGLRYAIARHGGFHQVASDMGLRTERANASARYIQARSEHLAALTQERLHLKPMLKY